MKIDNCYHDKDVVIFLGTPANTPGFLYTGVPSVVRKPKRYITKKMIFQLENLLRIQKDCCKSEPHEDYFRGMYNGMGVIASCITGKEPDFINYKKTRSGRHK